MDFFQHKLDDKNRLTLPSELHQEFASGIVLAQGFDSTIFLYPQHLWLNAVERALAGDVIDEENFRRNRQLRRGKVNTKLDAKQGRVTLPQHLLDYAGIAREVTATRVTSNAGSYWALESK
jgi:transcriptional regulator MraZ